MYGGTGLVISGTSTKKAALSSLKLEEAGHWFETPELKLPLFQKSFLVASSR